jgi:hypothetical protein
MQQSAFHKQICPAAIEIARSKLPARRLARLVGWLDERHREGARFTLGLPSAGDASKCWLGERLAWWSRGIPAQRRVALVSSRLGRALDAQPAWFAALRAACAELVREEELLLAAPLTATARFVERCAKLFGLPLLRVEVPRNDATPLGQWFRKIQDFDEKTRGETAYCVWLSPRFSDINHSGGETNELESLPLRDRALMALADRLDVLHLRRGGYLERLIAARLSDPAWPATSVRLAVGPTLVPAKIAARLLDMGAVRLNVPDATGSAGASPSHLGTGPRHVPRGRIISAPVAEAWACLTHCTRRQHGPWPDQHESEYWDELIIGSPSGDRSALAALERIIRTRRLMASALAIRGGVRVVSFTDVPLPELCRLRVFRPHRGRWDFEPYGICIQRPWLEQAGARRVRYGSAQLWESLTSDDRPFFQVPRTRRTLDAMDWTVEREWRHVGDVDLTDLPGDCGLIFVATKVEAERMAAISPWPVTIVGCQY